MPSVNFDACIFLLVFCLVCTCIYGYECNDGRYGQDCELRCGACLGNKTCHHINGSCPEGCDAGYRGDLCKTECSPSTYGFSCLNNCSLSCINFTCHHITGACTIIGTSQRFSDPPPDSTLPFIIGGLGAGYLLIVLVVIGFLLRIWHVLYK
ncbi:multiple epidermal growth factor-like domains protein 10 [Saccostrea cucullata]|uniref:multiple epidermal growth factor-like domains protein 10 n=1 Tax=Saccostrea cuccullata TaxID=36930 RepID=UPI002ED62C72